MEMNVAEVDSLFVSFSITSWRKGAQKWKQENVAKVLRFRGANSKLS